MCTNNTFGRNCDNSCDCDSSRLADGVDNQVCDEATGACKCSSNWQGHFCMDDVNECRVRKDISSFKNVKFAIVPKNVLILIKRISDVSAINCQFGDFPNMIT